MSGSLTIECAVHFERQAKGRRRIEAGAAPTLPCEPGRVPRVSKMLALAHRFEGLVRAGTVKDYATLARLGGVTRARLSQIMSLLQLAADIQEELLFLPRTLRGRDVVCTRQLLPVAAVVDWKTQRKLWRQLMGG